MCQDIVEPAAEGECRARRSTRTVARALQWAVCWHQLRVAQKARAHGL